MEAQPSQTPQPGEQRLKTDKQRKELWIYAGVIVASVELLITAATVAYGIISAEKMPDTGKFSFTFPWLIWGAASLIIPGCILGMFHYATANLFASKQSSAEEAEWQQQLPEKLQKIYRIAKGAPVFVVLLTLILFGATLATIDGAFAVIKGALSTIMPYLPYIIGGIAAVLCVMTVTFAWLKYSTRKLHEEYAFRREVLDRTGVIIIDQKNVALPSSTTTEPVRAITAGTIDVTPKALPGSSETDTDTAA